MYKIKPTSEFGKRLHAILITHDIKQNELANFMKCSSSNVSRYIKGKNRITNKSVKNIIAALTKNGCILSKTEIDSLYLTRGFSTNDIKIDLTGLTDMQKSCAFLFSMNINNLSDEQCKTIKDIIEGKKNRVFQY